MSGLELVGVLEALARLELAGPADLLGLALRAPRRDDRQPARQQDSCGRSRP